MTAVQVRRAMGMAAGILLVFLGALGIWISKSDYANPVVRRFCDAWFCPDEFSPERTFRLGQKATLGDAAGQLADFQRAILSNSASAYRWADLAESEFSVRDVKRAGYAFRRALAAGPKSPVIVLRAANFFFEIGDYEETIRQLSKILRDRDLYGYYDGVFLTYSRLDVPIGEILEKGIPPGAAAGSEFLEFLIKRGNEPQAQQTWEWLAQRRDVDDSTAGDYLNFLIAQKKDSLAQEEWRKYAPTETPDYRKTNWLFNGSFEHPFKPSPFDWSVTPVQAVDVERVKGTAAAGQWSLRLAFHGDSNVDYRQTYQTVVLPPGRWKFSGKIKTQEISTDEGPHFHVFDFRHPANLDFWTSPEIGTADWHETKGEFEVKPGTGIIRVELVRSASTHFDNKISGSAWVDELTLSKID